MQSELANLVYAVINRGVAVRERLDRGEVLNLTAEQAALKKLLLSDPEARRQPEFGGDATPGTTSAGRSGPFLGARYALVCWLDEVFVTDSPWEAAWNEQKLELALYGTNDRAWRFWEQARQAETRPATDALETFFLCVMLGFRGDLAGDPARLAEWANAARARMGRAALGEWGAPPALDPPTNVPPLRGRAKLQRMVVTAGLALLLLLPVVAFFVVQQLTR